MNLSSHWNVMGAEFCLHFPICKIKNAYLRWLPFTADLVQFLSLKRVSYFEWFDPFYYHNTQFCMTCLYGKSLGVLIILAPTVRFSLECTFSLMKDSSAQSNFDLTIIHIIQKDFSRFVTVTQRCLTEHWSRLCTIWLSFSEKAI